MIPKPKKDIEPMPITVITDKNNDHTSARDSNDPTGWKWIKYLISLLMARSPFLSISVFINGSFVK